MPEHGLRENVAQFARAVSGRKWQWQGGPSGPRYGQRRYTVLHSALPIAVRHSSKVEGIVIGIETRSYELKAPLPFCIPQNATNSQMVRVVIQYIDQRPQRMHEHFTALAYEALRTAWPCKPDQAGR
jgi:hypothetical protein